MALLINNFIRWFGEFAMPYSDESILHKDIHLGIQTNIVCLDDRPKDYKGFKLECLENSEAQVKINGLDYYVTLPSQMQDVSATLYLGKIIFKKNKQGNLVPIYIPSIITESSFEGLNTFWLNEINHNTPSKPTSLEKAPDILNTFIWNAPRGYNIDQEGYKYLKNFYFRSSHNITLTKDQIINYFTELHRLNTTFIKNYIDSINKNDGIRANILHDALYDELLEKGILQKDMFKWHYNGKRAYPQTQLITLDYLKTINHSNFTIAFFDELFYHYIFASISNFVIAPQSGKFCEKNNLIFNAGAYKKYHQFTTKKVEKAGIEVEIFNNWIDENYSDDNARLFFGNNVAFIIADLNLFYDKYNVFQSPNRVYRTHPTTGKPIYNDKKPPIYAPSPLGNYYFEIGSNQGTFIEFFPRIYPSIKNPPKGWNKEMMKKLELKLE